MTRIIKFRAWDKDEGGWLNSSCYYCGSENYNNDDGWELMQFTGLKDRNGVEIYEGDIVKIYEHRFSPMDFIVDFSGANHCWWLSSCFKESQFGTSKESFSFSQLNGFYEDCEVIGNIYENPELLKEKKDDEQTEED